MSTAGNNLNPEALRAATAEFAASAKDLRIRIDRRTSAIATDECEPFATLHEYSDLNESDADELVARAIASYLDVDLDAQKNPTDAKSVPPLSPRFRRWGTQSASPSNER